MAAFQNFRSALNGFNREDVVRYIEFINNKHNTQVNQLNTEIQSLQSQLDTLHAAHCAQDDLAVQLEEVQAQNAALNQELEELRVQLEQAANRPQTDSELEAYRRAERTERLAQERAELVYHRVNGVLADATVKVEAASAQIGEISESVLGRLSQLQEAIVNSKQALEQASATMYSLRPTGKE